MRLQLSGQSSKYQKKSSTGTRCKNKMKKQKFLIIHCSATYQGDDIRPETIREWHMGKTGRGWSRVGYSDLITIDGTLHNMHFAEGSNPFDGFIESSEMTWGVRGQNSHSKHICYVGGLDKETKEPKDTLTDDQCKTLEIYIKHEILRNPDLKVAGHNQFSSKACPSFNVADYCCKIGLAMKNVHL